MVEAAWAGDRGTCRACRAPMLWVRMVTETGAPKIGPKGKPVSNPLDAEPLAREEVDEALSEVALSQSAGHSMAGLVACSLRTGNGMALSRAVLEDVRRWVQAGYVSVHRSHFATCPARDRFKTTTEGTG